jgi:hypothetical protein
MKDDQAFAVSFVEWAEKYPCLWNCSSKECSNTDVSGRVWKTGADYAKDSG